MKSYKINLLAGSGCGKSTDAAGVFYKMKLKGEDVELVREFVKELVWKGHQLTPSEQDWYFQEQTSREIGLHGKVQYIITDSPLYLGPIYEEYYSGIDTMTPKVSKYYSDNQEVSENINIVLNRIKPFVAKGRNETEAQARSIDSLVVRYLEDKNIDYYQTTETDPSKRADEIISIVNKHLRSKVGKYPTGGFI